MKEVYETTIKVKSDTRDALKAERQSQGLNSIDELINKLMKRKSK